MNQHLTTDLLIDYLHGELRAEDDSLVHAHLAGCGACRDDYQAEVALSETLKAAAVRDEREMPSMVKARVWEKVRAAEPGPLARLAAWLRPAVALPVAAALVVATILSSPFGHPNASPTVDAIYYLEQHAALQGQNPLGERSSSGRILETSLVDGGSVPIELASHDLLAAGALDAGR